MIINFTLHVIYANNLFFFASCLEFIYMNTAQVPGAKSIHKLLLYFYDLPLSALPLLVPILFTGINSHQTINRNPTVTPDWELNILSPIHLQSGCGMAHVVQMISHEKKTVIGWFPDSSNLIKLLLCIRQWLGQWGCSTVLSTETAYINRCQVDRCHYRLYEGNVGKIKELSVGRFGTQKRLHKVVQFLCHTWSVHVLNSPLKNNYDVSGRTMTTKILVQFRNAPLDEYSNI